MSITKEEVRRVLSVTGEYDDDSRLGEMTEFVMARLRADDIIRHVRNQRDTAESLNAALEAITQLRFARTIIHDPDDGGATVHLDESERLTWGIVRAHLVLAADKMWPREKECEDDLELALGLLRTEVDARVGRMSELDGLEARVTHIQRRAAAAE